MQCLQAKRFWKKTKKPSKQERQALRRAGCLCEDAGKTQTYLHRKHTEHNDFVWKFRAANISLHHEETPPRTSNTFEPTYEKGLGLQSSVHNTAVSLDQHIQRGIGKEHSNIKNNIDILRLSENLLKDERFRLKTFVNYPQSAVKSAIVWANRGFFYIGNSKEGDIYVQCIFCSATAWESKDDSEEVHRTDCPMFSGDNFDNIPFCSSRNVGLHFDLILQQLGSRTHLIELDSTPSVQEKTESDLQTIRTSSPKGQTEIYSNQENRQAVQPSTGISVTAPASPTLTHLQNLPINSTLISNTNSTSPPSSTTSNQQSSANQTSPRNPTYSELGIITERPKRTEYALLSERHKSFSSWPRGHFLEPNDLVNAGFYYSGYSDCARCFFCGGGLKNWDDDDDVWVEHARWFPKCAYIRSKMGQAFVDTVKSLNESHDKISLKMVLDKIGTSAFTSLLDPRQNPLRFDPAVKTMVDVGYKEADVVEVAQTLKDGEMPLTADLLLEKLKEEGKRHETKVIKYEQKIPPEQALEVVKELKEKNLHLRQQTVCKMCLDNEVAVVFLPCGHLVSCSECSSAVSKCPMCRTDVKGVVRAFLS